MEKLAQEKMHGVYGLVLTPFKKDYEIDEEGMRKEIRLMVDNGVHVITPVGSTGEFASLTIDEHKKVIEISADEINGETTFIPGTSSPSQKVTLDLMRFAKEVGADAVMVLPAYYYNVLTEEAVYQWYKDLAQADIGIIIYNNPGLTKYNQSPKLLKRLAEMDHIIGIKEAHGNCVQFYKTLRMLGNKLPVLEGCGEIHALEVILLGAAGFYSGVAGFVPKLSVRFYNALKEGNLKEARKLSDMFEKFYNLCFLDGSCKTIAHYKAGFEYFGLGTAVTRPPILPITQEEKEKLVSVLAMLKREEEKIK